MSIQSRQRFFRRAVLGVWAVFTVILLLMVFILAGEVAESGQRPFAIPEPQANVRSAAPTSAAFQDFQLYFASADGRVLVAESHRLQRGPHTVDVARALLEALIRGPRSEHLPVVPPDTAIRGIYLLRNGELVVDLSREVEQGVARSASAEAIMAYGIVNTLAQQGVHGSTAGQDPVRQVRFLFEGSPPSDRFPRHLDLSDPIAPDSTWIGGESAVAGGNG